MTFDKDDKDSVVTKFEINGEAVEIDPEATSWSYTSTSADAGWQVTSVVFSTVNDYLTNSIADYYGGLVKKDFALASLTKPANSDWTVGADNYTSYYDTKVANIAKKAINEGVSTINSMSGSTIKDKLEKVETLVADAKEDIDEKYTEVLAEAKVTARKALTKSVEKLENEYEDYVDTDDTDSLLSDGKAAVDAATTLQGVAEAFDDAGSTKVNNVEYDSKYKTLITRQNAVIEAATKELKNVDSILDTQYTAAGLARQKVVIAALAQYGVEVSELPGEVADTYIKKALQARDLPLDSDKKVALAVEAEDAVEDAGNGVKTALYNGILASYKAEVDSLTKASSDLKAQLKAKLENAASEWKNAKTAEGTSTAAGNTWNGDSGIVEAYLGCTWSGTELVYNYDYKTEDSSDSEHLKSKTSLLGTLEHVLSAEGDGNEEIKAERVSNVLATYKTKWAAELASVKANDSAYADAIKLVKGSTVYETKVKSFGTTNAEGVTNFIFSGNGEADSDENIVREIATNASSTTSAIEVYYSAEAQYQALVDGYKKDGSNDWSKDEQEKYVESPSSFTSVKDAKTWAAANDGSISDSYYEFMKTLSISGDSTKSFSYKISSQITSTNFIKATDVTSAFKNKIYDKSGNLLVGLEGLEELAAKTYTNATNLNTLDAGLKAFVDKVSSSLSDSNFTVAYIKTGYGKFYEATLDSSNENSAFSKILAGTMSAKEVKDYVEIGTTDADLKESNLLSIYATDVLDYTQDALSNFKSTVESLAYKETYTTNQRKALNSAAEVVESLFKDDKLSFNVSGLLQKANESGEVITSGTPAKYIINVDKYIKYNTQATEANIKAVKEALYDLLTGMGFTVTKDEASDTNGKLYVAYDIYGSALSSSYSIKNADGFSKKAVAYVTAVASLF